MFTALFFKPKYLKKKNPVFSEAISGWMGWGLGWNGLEISVWGD